MAARSNRTNEAQQMMRDAFIYKDIPWYDSPGDIPMLISWFSNAKGHTVVDRVHDSLLFKNISSSVVLRKRWGTLCEFIDILQIGENLIDEAILNIQIEDLEMCLDSTTTSTSSATSRRRKKTQKNGNKKQSRRKSNISSSDESSSSDDEEVDNFERLADKCNVMSFNSRTHRKTLDKMITRSFRRLLRESYSVNDAVVNMLESNTDIVQCVKWTIENGVLEKLKDRNGRFHPVCRFTIEGGTKVPIIRTASSSQQNDVNIDLKRQLELVETLQKPWPLVSTHDTLNYEWKQKIIARFLTPKSSSDNESSESEEEDEHSIRSSKMPQQLTPKAFENMSGKISTDELEDYVARPLAELAYVEKNLAKVNCIATPRIPKLVMSGFSKQDLEKGHISKANRAYVEKNISRSQNSLLKAARILAYAANESDVEIERIILNGIDIILNEVRTTNRYVISMLQVNEAVKEALKSTEASVYGALISDDKLAKANSVAKANKKIFLAKRPPGRNSGNSRGGRKKKKQQRQSQESRSRSSNNFNNHSNNKNNKNRNNNRNKFKNTKKRTREDTEHPKPKRFSKKQQAPNKEQNTNEK
jgi:hypothetical protein